MNAARSNSLSKLTHLNPLLQSPPIVTGRAVSTLSSPLLKQSSLLSGQLPPRQLSPFVISVRHFLRYEIRPPVNWGIRIVPEKKAYVVERFGKYAKTLTPGIQVLVLYVKIVEPKLASYGVENPLHAVIHLAQTTMRSELGKIRLDKTFDERDTLKEKIVGISETISLLLQGRGRTAYTTLPRLHTVELYWMAINDAAKNWGLKCLRYEIRDISPSRGLRAAMKMQAENFWDIIISFFQRRV